MCNFLDWRWGQFVLKPSQNWGTINLKKKGKWMTETANLFIENFFNPIGAIKKAEREEISSASP